MISIFEIKDLDKIVFEKIKKPEKSKTEQELDELEFKELISRKKEKKLQSDENQLQKLFAHYKNEWTRYEDWISKDRKAKTLIRRYSEVKLHSSLLDFYTSNQCWKMFEDNYKNPTVAPIYNLFKKLASKNINSNSQKFMSEHTAEIQHLMQSMSDLAELTSDLLQALFILCSLSDKHIQLIQQIKVMNL